MKEIAMLYRKGLSMEFSLRYDSKMSINMKH